MKRALLLFLLASCTRRSLDVGGAAAWPMVGHDAQHSSASPVSGPSTPIDAFDFISGEVGFVSDPVIDAAGSVYVALGPLNHAARLFAIDPERPNDLQRWASSPCVMPAIRPAIAPDGSVYVTCSGILDESELVRLGRDGAVRWSVTSSASDATAPTIGSDGTIYVGSLGVTAYSPGGALLWQAGHETVQTPPALGDDGVVYFADVIGEVHAVTPAGVESWAIPVDGAAITTSCGVTVGPNDDVFACFQNGVLARLGADGSTRWRVELADVLVAPPAVGPDDTLYIVSIDESGASSQPTLRAFASDGTERWATLLDGTGGTTPSLGADGTLYVGSDQALAAFAADGTERWSTPLSGHATAIAIAANGELFAGASDGTLHAFGP